MTDFPVYLVDDDEAVRRSISFMLKTAGLRVETFETGTEFLRQVRSLPMGCILLDIRMPGADGLEVQKMLIEQGIDFPIIIITGHGDIDIAVKAMKAGAIDFVEKPFEKASVLASLEEGMERLRDTGRKFAHQQEAQVKLNGLTERERDVLDGLVKGYPNKTIGYDLGISPRTVEIHRANLMKKLDVYNLSDLLRIAFFAGLGTRS